MVLSGLRWAWESLSLSSLFLTRPGALSAQGCCYRPVCPALDPQASLLTSFKSLFARRLLNEAFPQCTPAEGEGHEGFPAAPRERPRESFFNASQALVPSRDSRARTRSPSPRAWRPDFPGAAREGLLREGNGTQLQYSCLAIPMDVGGAGDCSPVTARQINLI